MLCYDFFYDQFQIDGVACCVNIVSIFAQGAVPCVANTLTLGNL